MSEETENKPTVLGQVGKGIVTGVVAGLAGAGVGYAIDSLAPHAVSVASDKIGDVVDTTKNMITGAPTAPDPALLAEINSNLNLSADFGPSPEMLSAVKSIGSLAANGASPIGGATGALTNAATIASENAPAVVEKSYTATKAIGTTAAIAGGVMGTLTPSKKAHGTHSARILAEREERTAHYHTPA